MWLLPLGMAALAISWWWGPRQRRRPARVVPTVAPRATPATEAPASASPERSAPPRSGSAPSGCPEDEDDAPGFVRPRVWELLRTRDQELRDRLPQLSRDASPELREGLHGLSTDQLTTAIERLRAAPDRRRDGFDIAVAGTLHVGMLALSRGDVAEAQRWARVALEEGPEDALAHAYAGLTALRAGATIDAARRMARAFELTPDEPAIALEHARAEVENGRFEAGVAAIEVYLAEVPDDVRLRAWRVRMRARAEFTRAHARRTDQQITTLWPDRLVDARRIDELTQSAHDAMVEVAALTQTSVRQHLVVVVYRSLEELRRATCAPSWSGGIFDGVLHLDAATVNRPGFARTVRHEATHAQLRMMRRRIPTWLNEGLAQDMEGSPRAQALAAWRRMSERNYWIPFASLEGELISIDDPTDAALAYHQSLAMYLYLRERGGPTAVRAAFTRIEARQPEDILPTVVPGADGRALLAFMRARSR